MSALIGHAKAARILAEALFEEARILGVIKLSSEAAIIVHIAQAHRAAADVMEQAMREEATGLPDSRESEKQT